MDAKQRRQADKQQREINSTNELEVMFDSIGCVYQRGSSLIRSRVVQALARKLTLGEANDLCTLIITAANVLQNKGCSNLLTPAEMTELDLEVDRLRKQRIG